MRRERKTVISEVTTVESDCRNSGGQVTSERSVELRFPKTVYYGGTGYSDFVRKLTPEAAIALGESLVAEGHKVLAEADNG